jgi:branched-chain amino acid transport system ATP-binding protein
VGFTGLIGPNGAGKTTLFNVITGLVAPTAGSVVFDGQDITATPAHRRVRMGIGRTFQHLELFSSLTVRDNVLVAAEAGSRWRADATSPGVIAEDALRALGLEAVAGERAGNLTTGTARLVEVARALALEPRLLLLDEPSAGLDRNESSVLAEALLPLAASRAVLVVEHDVDFVMSLCSHIYVLNLGQILASGSPALVRDDAAVQRAYLGAPQGATAGARA